jgi:DNA-binding HxlR family transcriptional regulator
VLSICLEPFKPWAHATTEDPETHVASNEKYSRSNAIHPRSRCPVSCTLDLLGDRWTMLVVRDLMRGKRRFAELIDSPESIPSNILADRLKRLSATGVVRPRRYSEHPPRVEYELTAKGEDLRLVMRAMVEWGVRHAGGRTPPRLPPRRRSTPR